MNVIETAPNGVVNKETIFHFHQHQNSVHAQYSGGQIENGYLVGKINNDILIFSYCQLQIDDVLDNGKSTCKLMYSDSGKIRLVEHFEWNSRPGPNGTNIFEEI